MVIKKFVREGKTIVRLKGGDPFIFGRGGVEAEFLVKEGISFDIIPGVSSISSVPTHAGIPLTHPTISSSILVVTGRDNIEAWSKAPLNGTIVILMGRDKIAELCEKLIKAGRSPSTPVAVIENGTTKQQRVLMGKLSTIAKMVKREDVKGPTLIVVGEVVKMAEILNHKKI
jgi:uroporphyrin-III C-methyltransferase